MAFAQEGRPRRGPPKGGPRAGGGPRGAPAPEGQPEGPPGQEGSGQEAPPEGQGFGNKRSSADNGPREMRLGLIVGKLPDPAVASFLCGSPPEKDCAIPVGSIEPVLDQDECPACRIWAVISKGRVLVLSGDNSRVLKSYEIPRHGAWWRAGRAIWSDFDAGGPEHASIDSPSAGQAVEEHAAKPPAAGAPGAGKGAWVAGAWIKPNEPALTHPQGLATPPSLTKEEMAKIIREEVRDAQAAKAAALAPAPAPAAKSESLTKEEVARIVQAAVEGAARKRDQEEAERRKAEEERRKKEAPKAPAAIVSAVDKPSYSIAENPENYAVVVGIEKYADLPAARFAERDAAAVREHLVALGFPERNVVLLTGVRASKAGIAKNVESWLPNNVTAESTVFFYYSGHGAPDAASGLAFLVPADGDPQYLRDTAYSVKQLYKKLKALKAKRVIVALDACFSGAGGRSVLAKGTRPLVTKVAAAAAEEDGKIVSLSASAADEISGMTEKQGHGLFTYYLLKGLNGGAQDADGKVTVKGLYDYLSPRVQNAARRDNRSQTPQLSPAELPDDDPVLR